jgi:acyl-[acyl-carrier-protein]-phospholipid O-acyltransferase/long-chain-fatty-acid--[acyl-carrier-protein] ligase
MPSSSLSLLFSKRFAPLFAVQFLGAFNDNLLKFAMLFMVSFGISSHIGTSAGILATIATGLFILPYFVFSGIAGSIADAMDKTKLIRIIKLAEIGIMAIAIYGFVEKSIPVLFFSLFLMGCHSTLFGPVKYSAIPRLVGSGEIVQATGLVEAGTFIAILAGQLSGGFFEIPTTLCILMLCSIAGAVAAFMIDPMPPTSRSPISWNVPLSTFEALKSAHSNRAIWLSILGISWFFAIGAVLLSEFAPLISNVIGGEKSTVTLFLLIFSVGVASGSIWVSRRLQGEISARHVPFAALGMAAALLSLWIEAEMWSYPVLSAGELASSFRGWRLMAEVAAIAITGGIFIVPLYAILQARSDPSETSRVIAANNIVNAIITVILVSIITFMMTRGETIPGVIGFMGVSSLVVALISCWLLPETVFKSLVRTILGFLYKVEVVGSHNFPKPGQPSVVVVNHVSFLDGVLIAAFMPGRPTFAINTHIAQAWWVKPALMLFDAFPVDPTNPMAAKAMVKAVRDEGRSLVIFPEGRITTTGSLMKIFDGPGMVAAKAGAPVVPVRIDGAQFSPMSRLKGKVKQRLFPAIRITVLEPRHFEVGEDGSARERRKAAGRTLYDCMSSLVYETSGNDVSLFEGLIEAAEIHGFSSRVLEDVKRSPLSYRKLITGSFVLGEKIISGTSSGENVGLLLPNVNAAVVAFFGLQAFGRVPAMLNFTAGLSALSSACETARISKVITSRAFVEQAKLEGVLEGLSKSGSVKIVFLEDVAGTVSFIDKMKGLALSFFARMAHRKYGVLPGSPAVVLFTSGSEGVPKGVVLSHRNLLANARQLSARVDFNPADIVFNALPIFHSFGLGGGLLLPLLNGVKVFLYPSPLHYRIVPAVVYDCNATIMFGTDTFLNGYARMASPYDFYSVRYIFAGAERVKPETRTVYADKFGLRILEGYGATETSPVIAVNTPMHFRAGTVGRLLPGMECRLEDVPGIDEGGRFFVKGPNVMLGYYLMSSPGVLVPPADGWHDTGDIVSVDDDGFITIRGRAKRFAKIGGEMVSLPAVEANAAKVWPGFDFVAVTRPDPKKGEQIVLVTNSSSANYAELLEWCRKNGVPEIAVPKEIRFMDKVPVLGTGKIDYVSVESLVRGS